MAHTVTGHSARTDTHRATLTRTATGSAPLSARAEDQEADEELALGQAEELKETIGFTGISNFEVWTKIFVESSQEHIMEVRGTLTTL